MSILSYAAGCCYVIAVYANYLFTAYQRRWYRHVGWLLSLVGMLAQGFSLRAQTHGMSQPLNGWLLIEFILWLGLVCLLWRGMRRASTGCLTGWLLLSVWVKATELWWHQPMSTFSLSLSVLQVHIMLATLTAVLVVGVGIQAMMVLAQDRLLRQRPGALWLRYLPSLHSMERCLFSLLVLGVGALTVCVITSGFFFFSVIPTTALWLSKLAIVWIAWLTFSIVLAGHYWFGWRAPQVSVYTMIAVFLLILVYAGSQWLLK